MGAIADILRRCAGSDAAARPDPADVEQEILATLPANEQMAIAAAQDLQKQLDAARERIKDLEAYLNRQHDRIDALSKSLHALQEV